MTTPKNTGVTLSQANLKIAGLSRQAVEAYSGREDLDRPVDWDIKVEPSGQPTGKLPGHSVNLIVRGVRVSWAGIIDFRQQIGPCVLRMGGVAGVGTHNEHRFKNYSRRVMDNSLRWMRQAGYDITMLFGITGFYPKYGYVPAFCDVTWSLALRDAERLAGGGEEYRFADFDVEKHLPAVLAMYRQNNAGRTGALVRDPATWRPFRIGVSWGLRPLVRVALDARGKPAGYFVYDTEERCRIVEIGYASPAVLPAIIREVAAMAAAQRVEKITFGLPEDHLAMRLCRPLGLEKIVRYRSDGWQMARLINIPSTFEKLSTLLAGRMSSPGRLGIYTNLDSVKLAWRAGRMDVRPSPASATEKSVPAGGVYLSQWALTQLVFGYRDVESLALAGAVVGKPAALAALAEMFPQQQPYLPLVDEF